MKKILKFTTLVAALLVFAGVFFSCKKGEEKPQQGCVNEWCFYIENASKPNSIVEVRLMVYDTISEWAPVPNHVKLARTNWESDGFTIELPKTLEQNHLRTLFNGNFPASIPTNQPTVTVSNENVRVATAHVIGFDKRGLPAISFSPVVVYDNEVPWGFTQAIFTYVDSDVTISGYTYVETGFGYDISTAYSIEWEKGWNVWYFSKYEIISETGRLIMTEQWTTSPIDGLKWGPSGRRLNWGNFF